MTNDNIQSISLIILTSSLTRVCGHRVRREFIQKLSPIAEFNTHKLESVDETRRRGRPSSVRAGLVLDLRG